MKPSKRKVAVVTGCLGFIGRYITVSLLNDGWLVYGIDKETYAAEKSLVRTFSSDKDFQYLKADIKDIKRLPDCDYVINVAAESHVDNSIDNSRPFVESNVDGVRNLLELIRGKRSNNRPIFFQFSTDEVYGDIESGEFYETDNLNPSNPYAATKAAADLLVKSYARTYGVEYIIFRPTNNYGIGQYPEKLIPFSVGCLVRERVIPVHNNGTPSRNWLHVRDTALAVMTLLNNSDKAVNQIFNCEGGFEQTNEKTLKKVMASYKLLTSSDEPLEDLYGRKCDFSYSRPGQDVRYALNDDKLRELGWTPQKKFDEEIDEIVKFYIENHIW